nr:autotransporter-associated beta strand repeat-containing protein [Verrucomicrobium spinosum]
MGGAINGVGFGLVKNGTGTLSLSGQSTFTGTSVSARGRSACWARSMPSTRPTSARSPSVIPRTSMPS